MAKAQKCAGVQKKTVAASAIGINRQPTSAAAQPASTAQLPAAPPMTMLSTERRLRNKV